MDIFIKNMTHLNYHVFKALLTKYFTDKTLKV